MKNILVTTSWDDGHRLDMRLAALLKRYSMKGTFYISPQNREIPMPHRLNDRQIVELAEDFEIGAHTMTHPLLTDIDEKTAQEEIVESKKYLEGILKKPVTSFCYPAGMYTEIHARILEQSGFARARTVKRFASGIENDRFALPTTIHAYRHWSDAVPILKHVGSKSFFTCYVRWDKLAIASFERVLSEGGVFHLWGHSLEIEKNDDWDRLERVLKHIGRHRDAHYVTNGELI